MIRVLRKISVLLLLLIASHIAFADTDFTKRPDVQRFIKEMAAKHHFQQKYLIHILSQVKKRPDVMRNLNAPLERSPWDLYRLLFVNEALMKGGVKFWNKYEDSLQRAEKSYGIPASIIVATIGIESRYGKIIGKYRVIDALANIGFSNSKRAPYFRKELEEFFILTREQDLNPLEVMGSYAGAIGQPQFMPSSYRYYGVNFSKGKKIDLMHDEIDVIGSIANYYKRHGWNYSEPIAVRAFMIGERFNYFLENNNINAPFTLAQLAKYGVYPRRKIYPDDLKIRMITLPGQYTKEYWLGFHNFEVIRRYNFSDLYAMAVYQLSTYISSLRDRQNNAKT